MRLLVLVLALSQLAANRQSPADTTVTLLHFSDYHSHALPFHTDEGELGGIARAIGYLRQQKRAGALVFSGGDMINKGAPAWSDKYQCAEWPWLNGIVSAMAFGNHEPDYGREAFERCRAKLDYPILSANTAGFQPSVVLKAKGVRIGVFAVAGPDFERLNVGRALARQGQARALPAFGDSVAAARETVAALRRQADVIVMIGHQSTEDDYALARAVPGIDVIFGTHSHLKQHLTRIEGTNTTFISPWQYLTYVSRVEVTVGDGRVKSVRGGLVPVDASMPADPRIAGRVAQMQRDLERDPQYRALFEPIGRLERPMTTEAVAQRTLAAMRDAAKADVAISTKSSFRRALPAGTLTLETLRAALPYDNEIVVCTMTAAGLRGLLDAAGAESYVTPVEPKGEYRVATTDYLASVAYPAAFACDRTKTGLRVREELRKRL